MFTRSVRIAYPRRLTLPLRILPLPCSRQCLSTTPILIQTARRQPWRIATPIPIHTRHLSISSIPPVLLPPLVFIGLLISLWTWKSIITILFQDKIIYMPYMPPFARSEKLSTYTPSCHPVTWTESTIKSSDGTTLALALGTIPSPPTTVPTKQVVIAYFQGNGSSTPPRIPLLSSILKLLPPSTTTTHYTIAALSYRGYWKSHGRPSQSGIELDSQAFLSHLTTTHPNARVILWGQSVGAGIACTAAATFVGTGGRVEGLVLETPFTSIKAMLLAVYESRWLPYRYLSPFLWNRWDSEGALRRVVEEGGKGVRVLLLPASRDELVPKEEVGKLEGLCRELGLEVERFDVLGAYHTEATTKREGQVAVARFVKKVVDGL